MSTQMADKYWDSCCPVQRWTPYRFVGVWTAFPTSQPSLTHFLGVFLSAAQTPEVKLTAAAAATFCLWEPHWCSSPSPSPVPVPVPHQGRMGFPRWDRVALHFLKCGRIRRYAGSSPCLCSHHPGLGHLTAETWRRTSHFPYLQF